MRKMMLLAAMLAMVLVAAAPALAQVDVTTGDSGDTTGDDNSATQYCTQVQAALASQVQYGDATSGDATGDSAASVAAISQELGISQEAVQNCIQGDGNNAVGANGDVATNGVDDNGDGVVDEAGETASGSSASGSSASGSSASGSSASGSSASAGTSVLPDTGGASLFTLGAGALLVGGGLLARRIFS